ncbi:hypothetical protein CGT92_15780 [Vibrio metoecus]|uniref:glycosyltransferase family 4 protein n=1 Tax=Vibrio metoecus TaxID=1481663 RepID=UPI0006D84178|nr:glycosyltransferase family 4 protein [Vibrio metoecus]KQA98436.1 hypothetical protein XV91_13180 [Vibrio metoecus]PAR54875.1 hypothetical protein CGT92_15780 [Vibrio metoecus]PAR67527.1 hypothetical protein CGT91_07025 [Vibrio metoecus]
MKKVSIAFYSTFQRPGWKSEQLEVLVPRLKKEGIFSRGYGIKRRCQKSQEEDIKTSVIPLLIARLINKITIFKDYYGYLAGEFFTGVIFKNKIKNDDSEIVYLKPRPLSLVKACKGRGKFIVLEFGEMHPFDTYSRVNGENIKHGIKSRYIFTSKYAINQAVKAIDYADLIVVLSDESKKSFIRNGVDEKKIKVVNLGLTQKYENRYSIDKEFAFVSTAKHSLVKGSHNLLLAWRDANVNNMKLYMVGPISRELILFIEKHGPFNNVVFSGPKNVHDFYINYNFIGILNSLSEGYGRSVIEYMGYGFPVITTPVATCDIVEHGREGLIVDGHQELVMALRYFSENLEQYEVMGGLSRFSAEKTLKDNYVDKMIEIFKSV